MSTFACAPDAADEQDASAATTKMDVSIVRRALSHCLTLLKRAVGVWSSGGGWREEEEEHAFIQ